MATTVTYLTKSGGVFITPSSIHFGETPARYSALEKLTVAVPLVHQGLLGVTGNKGAQLLQGQVTCDIDQLSESTFLTGAQCTPQGRMLSSFRAFQLSGAQRLLQMNVQLVDNLIEILSKYAAFFQVSLSNVSNDYQAFGITGNNAAEIIQRLFSATPKGHAVAMNTDSSSAGEVIACQISAQQYQILTPNPYAETIWQKLMQDTTPAGTDFWTLQNIKAGLGEVSANTTDMFIPQMMNLQATNAISFNKGCYTGQEIVARTKYLGKLKKRMYRFEVSAEELPSPGTACFLPGQTQRIGNVVTAAWKNPEQFEALIVLNNDAVDADSLVFEDMPPAPCNNLALPYLLNA